MCRCAGVFAGPRGRGDGLPTAILAPRDGMMCAVVSSLFAVFGNSLARTPIMQSAGHLVWYNSDDMCYFAVLSIVVHRDRQRGLCSEYPSRGQLLSDLLGRLAVQRPRFPRAPKSGQAGQATDQASDPRPQDLPRPSKTIRLTHHMGSEKLDSEMRRHKNDDKPSPPSSIDPLSADLHSPSLTVLDGDG